MWKLSNTIHWSITIKNMNNLYNRISHHEKCKHLEHTVRFHIFRCQHLKPIKFRNDFPRVHFPACNDLPLLIHHNAAHAAVLAPRVASGIIFRHQKALQKKRDVEPEFIAGVQLGKCWFIAGKTTSACAEVTRLNLG